MKVLRRQIIQAAGLCAAGLGQWPMARAATAPALAYDWRNVPFGGGGYVDGLVFHPREAGLLYARTDAGGAYRFDLATRAWVPLLDSLSRGDADLMGVLSLAVDPKEANRVYLACGQYLGEWARNGALLSSNDRGASWRVTELGIKLGGRADGRGSGERLQVDPHQGEVLLLGTTRDGLMKSTDRGQSFRRLGFQPKHVSLVLFDPSSGSPGTACRTVYAGSHDQPGLYVSNDGGSTFAREAGAPEQVPQRAVFGPDGTLYVSFCVSHSDGATNPGNVRSGSVWKRDAGGRWTDITPIPASRSPQGFGYSGLDVDRQVPGRLMVSTLARWGEGDDVFLSTDDGAHWTPLASRSKHQVGPFAWALSHHVRGGAMGSMISDLKIDPFNGDRAVYGTGYGLYLTENLRAAQQPGGILSWTFAVDGLEQTTSVEIRSPSAGASLLAVMGEASGAAWDNLTKPPRAGLFLPHGETNRSVDHAELQPAIVVRVADQASTGGYISVDGALTWRPFGPTERETKAPNGGYLGAGRVAISAKGNFMVWAPERQAALWTRDLGATWKEVAGWPTTRDVELTPVADRAIDGVFYVYDRTSGRILVSVDGGASFKPIITGLPVLQFWQSSQLISAPGTMRDLWLAVPDGLLYLAGPDKRGRTIKGVADPWLIAVGKAAPGASYHSLYVWGKVLVGGTPVEGLFRSDDTGASFKRIDDDQHRFGRLQSLAADPLEHGVLYVAAQGRGLLVGKPRAAGS
ncbi:hypothetical protein [Ideonella sp. YS5]|uniref:hypothetical protein n=1 Tax=Ideonella sp. YS5 TaxID=3453714 RepID=UPI003EEE54F6